MLHFCFLKHQRNSWGCSYLVFVTAPFSFQSFSLSTQNHWEIYCNQEIWRWVLPRCWQCPNLSHCKISMYTGNLECLFEIINEMNKGYIEMITQEYKVLHTICWKVKCTHNYLILFNNLLVKSPALQCFYNPEIVLVLIFSSKCLTVMNCPINIVYSRVADFPPTHTHKFLFPRY